MRTVLLVEDECDILENNRRFFAAEGYRVLTAENLAQTRERLSKETPDAIVLDIMLPDGNGLDLLSELRAASSKTPVLMLTAWGKSSDVARGLKLGANDYMSKPFTYEVLQARVEAMFRNVEQVPELVEKGPLTLKLSSMSALLRGKDILLTQKEFALLLLFVQHEEQTMSADYLYKKVWGQDTNNDVRAVKYQVSNLREKIEGSGYAISAIRNVGYRFEQER
jgi:DNA-binding response OmpR family regulator